MILVDCRVCIFAGQLNGEGETCSPWDDDVVGTQVWESHKLLLVLIDSAWIVGNHYTLPDSFHA